MKYLIYLLYGMIFLSFYMTEASALVTFGTDVRVDDSNNISIIRHTDIIVSNTGNIYIVWEDDRNDNVTPQMDIFFSKSIDGGVSFSSNTKLTNGIYYIWYPGLGYGVTGPSVACDTAGNIYVAAPLRKTAEGTQGIYITKSTDGGATWSTWAKISDDLGAITQEQWRPDLYIDKNNIIYAVWEGERNPPYPDLDLSIWFDKSIDGGNTWGGDVQVDDWPGGSANVAYDRQIAPTITVENNGTIHVMWTDARNDALGYGYYAKSTDGGASFSASVDTGVRWATKFSIDVYNSSNIYATWDDAAHLLSSSMQAFFMKSSDGGATWPAANIRVMNENVPGDAIAAFMDMDDSGTIYGIWLDTRNWVATGAGTDIFFSYSTDGGNTFEANVMVDDLIAPNDRYRENGRIYVSKSGGVYIVFSDTGDGASAFYGCDEPHVWFDGGGALIPPEEDSSLILAPLF